MDEREDKIKSGSDLLNKYKKKKKRSRESLNKTSTTSSFDRLDFDEPNSLESTDSNQMNSPAPLYNDIMKSYSNNTQNSTSPITNTDSSTIVQTSTPLQAITNAAPNLTEKKAPQLNIFNDYETSTNITHPTLVNDSTLIDDDENEQFSELLASNDNLDSHDEKTPPESSYIKDLEEQLKFERFSKESVETDLKNTRLTLQSIQNDVNSERQARIQVEKKILELKQENENLKKKMNEFLNAQKEGGQSERLSQLHNELRQENEKLLAKIQILSDERRIHLEQQAVYQSNLNSLREQLEQANRQQTTSGISAEALEKSNQEIARLRQVLDTEIHGFSESKRAYQKEIETLKAMIQEQKRAITTNVTRSSQQEDESESIEMLKRKYDLSTKENEKLQQTLKEQFEEIDRLKKKYSEREAKEDSERNSVSWKEKYVESCIKLTELIKQRRNLLYEVEELKEKLSRKNAFTEKSLQTSQPTTRYLEYVLEEKAKLEEKNQALLKVIAKLTNLNFQQEQKIAELKVKSKFDQKMELKEEKKKDSGRNIRVSWIVPNNDLIDEIKRDEELLEEIAIIRENQ